MGLSSLPAPSEGVLCILLVNTALSISIVKGIVRSILHIVGIRLSASTSLDSVETASEPFEFRLTPNTFIEEFRYRTPAVKYGSLCNCNQSEQECPVCLNRFERDSEVNQLCCGHLFHKICLERWLDYWNITCPLCRTPLMPEEEASYIW
ncbi:probable E3 ubiquitin-protein ligase XERICO [Macadamia integrifolia]|uniref:probable E3 ubiquitin-protein ligase XERICO n=1 Tax=Macadamia integrifolia TaxID=60698 RepID=UPI001C52E1B4|nr:probable E3 ubiquitin-protein ligase XERICO [Macadamia integrifolia]